MADFRSENAQVNYLQVLFLDIALLKSSKKIVLTNQIDIQTFGKVIF